MKLLVVNPFAVTPIRQDFYARLQAASGWDVTIATARQWKDDYGHRVSVERWPGYHGGLIALPVLLPGNIPLHIYRRSLRRVMRRVNPDAIYVYHEPYGAATFQAFLANRGGDAAPIGFYSSQNLRKNYPWPFAVTERYVYRHASFAVAVSAEVAGVLKSKGYDGPLDVIPFGVDTARYKPEGRLDSERLRGGPQTLAIGYVGRLVPEKGVDTLLDAMALLPGAGYRALIVGDGPSRDELKAQAERLGLGDRVHWSGFVSSEDAVGLYHQMDVLVVPSKTTSSWKEQFGRVVIEALASGVCVVTSDSGELPYLVAATQGGWTFPEGNHEALASRLRAVREDPGELAARRVNGHGAVARSFSIDGNAARLIDVVERVVGHSTAQHG